MMHFVDQLAQEIRRVDGNHSLGAGALAEKLMPFIAAALAAAPAGAVNIKPLEWSSRFETEGGKYLSIKSEDGYQIEWTQYKPFTRYYLSRIEIDAPLDGCPDILEEAIATCQADFERRIRSALVPAAAETTSLVADIQRMAKNVGMEFIPDPSKSKFAADQCASSPVAQATDGWCDLLQRVYWVLDDLRSYGEVACVPVYSTQAAREMMTEIKEALAAAPTPKAEGEQ
jgi:hypothetical protein